MANNNAPAADPNIDNIIESIGSTLTRTAGDSIKIEVPIGLPPQYVISALKTGDTSYPNMPFVIEDSMPMMELIPCTQSLKGGLEGYELTDDLENFKNYLFENYNVQLNVEPGGSIKLAFMAERPPSESFSNDFGESSLAKVANFASSGIGEMAFATGSETISGGLGKLRGKLAEYGGMGKDGADMLGEAMNATGKAREKLMTNIKEKTGKDASSVMNTLGQLAVGAKLDFPDIWKSSSWSSTYSITVRLYNPDPSSDEMTRKYIIGPLAVIMSFVVPKSVDGHTFKWPWLCKYTVRGLYNVMAGYMKSASVIKGGNDNQIAMNQRAGIVDLNIDFGVLYKTMISRASTTDGNLSQIPNLADWLDNLADKKAWLETGNNDAPL